MQIISISKGSISKRASGHYRAQFIITYEDGTKERQSITADKKHDLLAKMVQFKKDIFAQHNEKDGSYKNSFVYYLLNEWMQEKRVVEKLEKHTLLTHEQRIRHDLKPFFGSMKPQDITAKHIIELYEKMVKRGLQPETIHRVHAIMNNAFKKLMRDDRVSKNPCQFIKLPKIVVEEKKPLTQDEVKVLLDTAKEYTAKKTTQSKNIYVWLCLAVASGCRRGELCGLMWENVDFENNTINIKYSLEEDEKGQTRLKAPKTDKPRLIAIAPSIMELLKEHRKNYSTGSFVFRANRDIDAPQPPSSVYRAFTAVRKLAGLERCTLHLLRHTHLSILSQSNIDIRTIAQRAGHHSIQTTMRYIHSNAELDRRASDLFNNI